MAPAEYPTWVYRCRKRENGTIAEDGIIVNTSEEWDRAEREGFVYGGPLEAGAVLERLEQAVGDAAAEAAYKANKRMSRKAQAEYARREAESDQHVTE